MNSMCHCSNQWELVQAACRLVLLYASLHAWNLGEKPPITRRVVFFLGKMLVNVWVKRWMMTYGLFQMVG